MRGQKLSFLYLTSTVLVVLSLLTLPLYAFADSPGAVGSWSTSPNNLPQNLLSQAAVTYNGYVYVVGGFNGTTSVDTVYSAPLHADGTTGAWTTSVHTLPQTLRDASVVADNGYIYVVGGSNSGTPQDTVYSAPISGGSVGTWTPSANTLPQPLTEFSAFIYNGYIYTVGGQGTGPYVNNVYAASISGGTVGSWSTSNPTLPFNLAISTVGVYNGYAYIVGGDNNTPDSLVLSAPLSSGGVAGSWTQLSNSLPQPRAFLSSVIYNGYIFVFGGLGAGLAFENSVYSAPLSTNGEIGAWTTSPNTLPTVLAAHSAILNNGFVDIIAGSDLAPTDTVYYARLTGVITPVSQATATSTEAAGAPDTGSGTPGFDPSSMFIGIASIIAMTAGLWVYTVPTVSVEDTLWAKRQHRKNLPKVMVNTRKSTGS